MITVQDEAGTQMDVSYDEAKDIYTVQTATNTISEEETTLALEASRVYARFMIEEAGSNQVAKYFDPTSDIYKTICRSETWMQSNQGYDFANETVSDYYRYTDDLFSVHVVMTLNGVETDFYFGYGDNRSAVTQALEAKIAEIAEATGRPFIVSTGDMGGLNADITEYANKDVSIYYSASGTKEFVVTNDHLSIVSGTATATSAANAFVEDLHRIVISVQK